MYVTTVAALLYTAVYNSIWKGILQAGEEATAGTTIGNLVTGAFGLYMVIAAVILFMDGIKSFNEAKATGAAPAAAD